MNRSVLLSLIQRGSFKVMVVFTALGYLFAYLPALLAFFVKDDLIIITSANLDLRSLLTHPFPGGFFRPSAEFIFGIQYYLFGLHPLPYHLISLAAHGVAGYLVFRISRSLLKDSTKGLVVAAVFVLHPLHTESASWVSGQMSLFAGLCGLLVLSILLSRPRSYSRWLFALVVAFLCGLGFYENLIVVPVLWVVLHLFFNKDVHQSQPPLLVPCLLLAGISGFYLYWRLVVLGLGGGNYDLSLTLGTGLTNLLYYLYLLNGGSAIGGRIIRYRPEEILSFPNFLEVITPLFIFQTLLIFGAFGLFLISRCRESRHDTSLKTILRDFFLPGVWVLISLLPALFLTERPRRIAYLAVPGYAIALGQALFYLQQRTRLSLQLARAGLVGYIALLSVTLHFRNQDWWAAGELEKSLPTVVTSAECSHLAFDVPDLLGDALFFNSSSVSYWIERQTGRKGLTVYGPAEIIQVGTLPQQTCFFRFSRHQVEQVQLEKDAPFPSFVRGQNWVPR